MTVEVLHGDCLAIIPELAAAGRIVDACVTDPPYHLVPTVSRFGKDGSAPAKYGKDGAMARLSSGFMQAKWDGGDVAFRPETWATVSTILRPGAFLVAFGGTRTYHRLACAIEDAGFIIQDSILDLIASDERVKRLVATLLPSQSEALSQILDSMQTTGLLSWAFATGFPKRKDSLKPAYEPIVLAYKPGGKRTLQVDECRIATADKLGGGGNTTPMPEGWDRPYRHDPEAIEFNKRRTAERIANAEALGRWPANICHDGSDEVVALFPAETGKSTGGGMKDLSRRGFFADGTRPNVTDSCGFGDSGSAARFFMSAKAGAQDRWGSKHPTVKPVELMKWLVALVTPPGGTCLDPFAGSGTTAVAALATGRSAILIEREDSYVADIRERLAFYEGGGTHSMQAKNRNRKVDHGPLFDRPYDPELDAIESYNDAMRAVGERVKAGSPIPESMLSRKARR